MKKVIRASFSLVFLLVFCTAQGFSVSGKDLLKKMIKAQGGRKNMIKVKDSVVKGEVEFLTAGIKGTVTISRIEPNRRRIELDLAGTKIIQAYDGKTAWVVHPQYGPDPKEMPENFAKYFKRQSIGNDTLLNPKKYGITYNYRGREMINGKDCMIMETVRSDGSKSFYYLDPKTYLVVKTKTKSLNQLGKEVDAETYYSDYRMVDGLMVPFESFTFVDGKEYLKFKLSDVKYNTNVNEDILVMPKKH